MKEQWSNRFRSGFLAGALVALLSCLLMAAVSHPSSTLPVAVLPPETKGTTPLSLAGRYQIAACSVDRGGCGVFILDTATGITKIVYGKGPDGRTVNHLGKPYAHIP
ncbi:hypothetical protein [Desulfobulbus alkaliphilus]|uniref:hypothetical protein n=1 Tax=Desulfobulbus alkaliphilus TaxID=869814 RepID=UPI0019645445|nr:hypothetical protein [Desulfobulbus alkaliphilus]MBM9536612.1 hypothetical protein [Desulfobulbus alkaliphilus]